MFDTIIEFKLFLQIIVLILGLIVSLIAFNNVLLDNKTKKKLQNKIDKEIEVLELEKNLNALKEEELKTANEAITYSTMSMAFQEEFEKLRIKYKELQNMPVQFHVELEELRKRYGLDL